MENFLAKLSTFWLSVYKEASLQIEASLQAQNQTFVNTYHQLLNRKLMFNLDNTPLYKEDFWNVLEFKSDEVFFTDANLNIVPETQAQFRAYKLPNNYLYIPYIQDAVKNPKTVLKGKQKEEFLLKIPNGFLIPNRLYVNRYNNSIIHNGKTIQPNESFFAENNNFTITPGSNGGVYNCGHYFIELNAQLDYGSDININTDCIIYFPKDTDIFSLFKDNTVFDVNGVVTLKCFAPKVYIELFELWYLFGGLVDVFSSSTEKYRNFLRGVFKLYTKGPTVGVLNEALNTAFGLPVSKEDDFIIKVKVEQTHYILQTFREYEYMIPRFKIFSLDNNLNQTSYYGPELKLNNKETINNLNNVVYNGDYTTDRIIPGVTYDVWWPVKTGEGFIIDLEIVDYISRPNWWMEKDLQDLVLSGLTNEQVLDQIKDDPDVINYLFDNYWKYHCLSLTLNFINLKFGTVFKDVFKILMDIKPTFKTFILSKLETQALSYQGENEITYAGLLENNPLALLPSENEPPLDIQQLLDSIEIPTELQLIQDSVEMYQFQILTTQHTLLQLLLSMDMIGMVDGDENVIGNPKIGVALDNVDLFYTIPQFTINIGQDLDENFDPVKGSIISQHDLGFGDIITVGQLNTEEENVLLGQAGFGGIIEHINFTVFMTAPEIESIIDVTEYTATIVWTDIDSPDYILQISTDPNFNIYSEYTLSTTSITFTDLLDATVYYVRVKGDNGLDQTEWSGTVGFMTGDYIIYWMFSEGSGNILSDSSITPDNPGILESFIDDGTALMVYNMDEGSGVILEDNSPNNNDAEIETDSPINLTIIEYNMDEGSGVILEDNSPNNNDAEIEDI